MVHDQSLHHLGERSGDSVRPQQTSAIDRGAHEIVAEAHLTEHISPSRRIDQDWEWRSLVRTIDLLVTSGCPQTPNTGEETKGVRP